jgi:cytochrome P450
MSKVVSFHNLQNMFMGGTDTSSTVLEWLMAKLTKNPSSMKRAQEEVRRVVGKKSKIYVNDINKMDYLNCPQRNSTTAPTTSSYGTSGNNNKCENWRL